MRRRRLLLLVLGGQKKNFQVLNAALDGRKLLFEVIGWCFGMLWLKSLECFFGFKWNV